MTEALVLSEADALEVLAYLITATRTQLDEAAEYGPLRLMGAARLLASRLLPSVSPSLSTLVDAIDGVPPTATPRADRDAYIARIDQLCVAVADCLLDNAGKTAPQ